MQKLPLPIQSLVKYAISGSTAGATDLVLLFLLTSYSPLNYLLSSIVAFLIAFIVSFNMQKYWTFDDKSKDLAQVGKQLWFYILITGFNLGINTLGMYLLAGLAGWHYLLAQIFIGLVIAVTGYTGYRLFVFDYNIKQASPSGRRLLIATGIYPPDIGGPATYSDTLRRELPRDGYRITLLTYTDEFQSSHTEDGQGAIYYINRQQIMPLRYLKYWWRLLYLVPHHDIVYVQGPVSEGWPAFLACKLANVPYYLKVVGDWAWEQGRQRSGVKDLLDDFQDKTYGPRVGLWRLVEKTVAGHARAVVVPSEYLKSIVAKWGVPQPRIHVIYNSVKPAQRQFSRREAQKTLGISGDIILTVGRLVPWKGLLELIEMMPDLLNHNSDFCLYVIGEGPERPRLEAKIKELKLHGKVLLLGSMPQSRLWFYMMAADMFVLNTAYEGMPHTTIEAMQIGLPVVTTDIGGNPEVVAHERSGLLVKFGDREALFNAIVRMNEDYDLRQAVIPAAQAKVKEFSQKQMLDGIKELFKQYENFEF